MPFDVVPFYIVVLPEARLWALPKNLNPKSRRLIRSSLKNKTPIQPVRHLWCRPALPLKWRAGTFELCTYIGFQGDVGSNETYIYIYICPEILFPHTYIMLHPTLCVYVRGVGFRAWGMYGFMQGLELGVYEVGCVAERFWCKSYVCLCPIYPPWLPVNSAHLGMVRADQWGRIGNP